MIIEILKSILIGLSLMGNSYLPQPLTIEEIKEAYKDIHP
jgi:hypothetical protein